MTEQQLSIAGWTRGQMIKNPQITFDQLVEAYDATSFPKDRRPKDKNYLYQQRTILFERWGIKSLEEIPKSPRGGKGINMSGMVRLYLIKHGFDSSPKDVLKFFATDDVIITKDLYAFAKRDYAQKQSPDDNQHKGPRAGKPEVVEPPVEKKRRGRGPNKSKALGNFNLILDAKRFVDAVGSIKQAKELLEVLEMVQAK